MTSHPASVLNHCGRAAWLDMLQVQRRDGDIHQRTLTICNVDKAMDGTRDQLGDRSVKFNGRSMNPVVYEMLGE